MDHQAKRILILHASAGFGHEKCALALGDTMRSLYPDAEIDVLDALDFFPRWLKKIYADIYLFLIHRAPFLWGFLYYASHTKTLSFLIRPVRRLFNGTFCRPLVAKILREDPDLIFCTHFLPVEVLANLKKRRNLRAPCVTVITDFMVHRFWIFKEIDLYAVAAQRTRRALAMECVDPRRIRVTGIPVARRFAEIGDRALVCKKLGLRNDCLTVLLTSGGSGVGPVSRILSRLTEDPGLQLLVVCGRNTTLWEKMSRAAQTNPNVKPFQFVDNMDELMDCADAVVGKAGGITLSEALAKRKLFFILSPVPGQEAWNAECLKSLGACFWLRDLRSLSEIRRILDSPEIRQSFLSAVDAVRKPLASVEVARAGMGLV